MATVNSGMTLENEIHSGRRLSYAGALAVAVAAALPAAAFAAEAAQTAPSPGTVAAGDNLVLENIVVTARRVDENMQEIPASIAAISGDRLEHMTSLSDIQSMVAGVTFQNIGPIPAVGIRGYGNRTEPGSPANSTIGIFQDGVFVSPALASFINSTDTARVEIAKGPQSTLYGRSSLTGAINIATNDPADELTGYVEAGAGQGSVHGEDLWHVVGAVSIPISDTLGVRLYGLHEERDGYAYDSQTGNRSGSTDRDIARVRILWEPTDTVTARLTGSIYRDDVPFPLVNAGDVRAPLGQQIVFSNPFNPAVGEVKFGDTVWDAQYELPQKSKIEGEQITMDLRFETPWGELASLTDYQNVTMETSLSLDLTRLAFATGEGTFNDERYSQEFRLSNEVGRFSYFGGLYYLYSEVDQNGGKEVNPLEPFAILGPGSIPFDFGGVSGVYTPSYTETESYAIFGQLGYDITEELNFSVGLRQGRDKISGTTGAAIRLVPGFVIPTTPITFREETFDATTGNAILSYQITPDILVYGSYARGDSPGGFNTGSFALVEFDPQNVDAFELGLKAQLFDQRLQLNAALFHNDYSDIQLSQNVIDPFTGELVGLVSNAAEARGRGIDIDVTALLSSNWRLGVQYTYVDSEITDYEVPNPPSPQVDLKGLPMVRSPENSFNASITYTHDIGPGQFNFTALTSYVSSYTNDYLGEPAGYAYPGIPDTLPPGVTTDQVVESFSTDSYTLTNLNAAYTWGNWQVSGNVRNLFDEEYVSTVLAFDLITAPLETPGSSRTYELSLRYDF